MVFAHALPTPRTSLVGRENEVSQTAESLLQGPERLVTLTGVGGSGKTRIALQVALEVLGAFSDGVVLVEFARISEPSLVPQTVAGALGISETRSQTFVEAIVRTLRAKQVLMVLDNCEHVIDACAELVDHLLAVCPDLRILATSREPMHVSGERQRRVPLLAVPPAGAPMEPDNLIGHAAVRLFVERARAVSADFELTADNATAVAGICDLLGGLPLAIELAAARIGVLSITQIQQRLDDCFRLLVSSSRSAPSRQQTLRATLDWSHDLLSPPEQTVFRRLALFPAGWGLDGAEALCAEGGLEETDVLDVLTRLVDKSLIMVEERSGEAYYRFLEPVRQYAQRSLADHAEVEDARGRLVAFYVRLAEQAEVRIHGPNQAGWLLRLEREFDNIRGVFHQAMERDDAEAALCLVAPLYWFFWMRHHLREAQHWFEMALSRAVEVPVEVRAKAQMAAALMCSFLADRNKGLAFGREALAHYSAAGVPEYVSWTQVTLGYLSFGRGDVEGAREWAEEGLASAREAGSNWHIGHALLLLGQVARQQGDRAAATGHLEEALAVFESHGDRWAIISTALALADINQERVDLWRQSALAAVQLYWEQGNRVALVGAIEYLAGRVEAGDAKTRVRLLSAAHSARETLSVPLLVGEREDIDSILAAATSQLGEKAYADAWTAGQSMSLDEVVETVMASAAESLGRRQAAWPGGLTRREWEVASLVAQGFTDRQIADELVIARGTASLHVHRILEKLALRSRFQVADWLVEHKP